MRYPPIAILLLILISHASLLYGQSDSIPSLLKREVDNGRSASIIVGVIDTNGQRIIGYGKVNDSSNQAPDGNTVYEIGSITKTFTSLLLAEMVIRGQVNLTDPISRFLPKSVKTPVRNGREITLLDLSTQRSGLPKIPDNLSPKDWEDPYADYTVERLYDFLSRYQLTRDIGSGYEYSNLGVTLLGHILTLVSGLDYETLVKQNICVPLRMNSTGITLTPKLKADLAIGHNGHGKAVPGWDFASLGGAGALRSTVNDMLIYAAANLGLIKTPLDSAIRMTHLIQYSTHIPDLDMAMAWHVWEKYDNRITWHNGGTGGYRSFLGLDLKRKRAVIVLSNTANEVDDIGLHILDANYRINPFH
jgi:D-alanyl-D-alanine-carboxypeptidase/D-alanyl-D-alanine-endopeptidase